MKRIITVLLTLLMLLPVCAAAEQRVVDSAQFQLPERTQVELATFVLIANTIEASLDLVFEGSDYESDFEIIVKYNTQKDAILVSVRMPRWNIYEILDRTDLLRAILNEIAISAVMITKDMNNDLFEPLDVYTVGFANGTTKYLNVNGRDLSSLAGIF